MLLPLMMGAASAAIDGLPEPGTPREMKFAKAEERKLGNGLRVIVVERRGEPLLAATMAIRSGAESDPDELAGLASLTAGLLERGTQTRNAPQIAADLEELGAKLDIQANWDGTLVTLSTLSPSTERAFQIFAEVICRPKFAEDEIERLRKERIDEVEVALEQASQLARLAAARQILGRSPYAHASSGTPASLARIKRSDIVGHHQSRFQPGDAALIIAGDIDAGAAFSLAEQAFGDWRAEDGSGARKTAATPRPNPAAILIDDPDAGQAAVYVGGAQEPRSATPEYYAGQVANAILGGGYSARLNREVRVRRGLSYGCGSRISGWREGGIFGASCQTKNESAAEVVEVIRKEVERMAAERASDEELTARRLVLTGGFQRDLETNEGYVKRIADFVLHDQPVNSFQATLDALNAIGAEDVMRFVQSRLSTDGLSAVVVGKASICEAPLRKLFPGLRVLSRDDVDLDQPSLEKK